MKSVPIIFITIATLASLILYGFLLTIEKNQVTFSDEGDIAGDGNGPYEDGVAGIRIETHYEQASGVFSLIGHDSPRSVYATFTDSPWEDEHLRDTPPRLPSGNYRIDLAIYLINGSIPTMEVGDHLELSINLALYEADSGEYMTELIRDLNDNATDPPPQLYNQGHAYLARESQDAWTLDVDAWFRTEARWLKIANPPKYYVRLSFRMIISSKGMI